MNKEKKLSFYDIVTGFLICYGLMVLVYFTFITPPTASVVPAIREYDPIQVHSIVFKDVNGRLVIMTEPCNQYGTYIITGLDQKVQAMPWKEVETTYPNHLNEIRQLKGECSDGN